MSKHDIGDEYGITAIVIYIIAMSLYLVSIFTRNTVYLCAGSAFLCFGAVITAAANNKKSKKSHSRK